jgi:uncharacterized integral membrane protein (TIGR00698 family)
VNRLLRFLPGLPALPGRTALPGLTLAVLIAGLCMATCSWMLAVGPSAAPAAALLTGMLVRCALPSNQARWALGVDMARRQILRGAVVLVGLQVSVQDLAAAGWSALLADLLMVVSTLLVGWWLGRVLRLERSLSVLIGVGAAICGTSAVLAAQQALGSNSSDTALAVGTVVGAGLACLLLYPVLWSLNVQLQLFDAPGFGRFVGSTVHELAQVLAVTGGLGKSVTDTAVVAKMGRIALLFPTLLVLAIWTARSKAAHDRGVDVQSVDGAGRSTTESPAALLRGMQGAVSIPLFFGIALGAGLLWPVPPAHRHDLTLATTALLTVAMAGAGLSTRLASIREAGFRPLALGMGLFAWLVLGGASINALVDLLG